MTDFSRFGLVRPIASALAQEGYETPTPIQTQAIPIVMAGRDCLGIAQTGTGKTAAFALPVLDRLSRSNTPKPPKGTRALVLSPTRELASQIAASFKTYGARLPLSVTTVFGGVPIQRQLRQLKKGTDILVATPGRMLDLVDQRALRLDHVEMLVLDEADQMLDLGFIHALRRVFSLVPEQRQTVLFSATMPKSIGELASCYLTDPQKVTVAPVSSTAERVEQQILFTPAPEKPTQLLKILQETDYDRVLVFSRTKHGADRIVKRLAASGFEARAIHGGKAQPQRERALKAFRTGDLRILVATDIAARGIDIPGVSHVINFDLPNVPEQYVHRIGRTARAGAEGLAISFVAVDERPYLKDIEKLIRRKLAPNAPQGRGEERRPPGKPAKPRPESQTASRATSPKRRRKRKPKAAGKQLAPAS